MSATALTYDFQLDHRKAVDASDPDKLVISGIASNYDLDREGERMSGRAFEASLGRYLRTNPILLYGHRYSVPLGRVTAAYVGPDGLHVTAEIPKPEPGTEQANVWRLIKAGVLRAFSVGGYGVRKVINGVTTILEWDLREVSVAAVGVNPNALFTLTEQVRTGKCFSDAPADEHLQLARTGAALLSLGATVREAEARTEIARLRRSLR